ncbi:MAG TPA: DNA polymerase III subunit alpha, partial [Candidatus Dojkabacteria bacterium]|nr:DNA polymerase III subunit alpha [Candidatus Dojkabacteria bacterium]
PIAKMRKEVKEFDEMVSKTEQLEELVKYVAKLENIARHVSIHACGYLVTPKEITTYVPVQIETKGGGKVITQVEGQHLEPMGLMKFDFLGLSNLSIIAKAIKQIEYNRKKIIDIEKIPLDDALTFKLFQSGNTTGIFQFESDGMKKYLRDLKPTVIEDLIFLNAAYRPGPMKYIHDYIERKQGKQKTTYLHPSLEPILKKTFGYAIYQEQVINIAVEYAKYQLGEADMLRRAMGKKKQEIMDKEKVKFLKKAVAAGHDKKNAAEVFAYLEPFADYGFNRSHSACYSLIAFQTAYLKAHYPVEFMASLLENDADTPDKLKKDLQEAKEMKINILPPDINKSYVSFSIEDHNNIRFGFNGVKGLGEKVMKYIVKERRLNGAYHNLDELLMRNSSQKVSKKDLECLIKVGAVDNFGYRNQLLTALPVVFERLNRSQKQLLGGQADMFDESKSIGKILAINLPLVEKESEMEKLIWEKELLGTFISTHPLSKFQFLYATDKIISLRSISELSNKKKFSTLALIVKSKTIYTKKKGDAMAFLEIEDLESKCEAVIFPRIYQQLKEQLIENIPLIITATVSLRNDQQGIVIENIVAAESLDPKKEAIINITRERDKDSLVTLKRLLKENPGKFKLKIIYGDPYQPKEIVKNVAPTNEVISYINKYRKR